MKLSRIIFFLVLLVGVLASVSNINLNPTGNYPKISTKGGLYVSVIILIYIIFGELGYIPFRFKGRKRRSIMGQMMGPMLGDRDVMLKLIRSLDHEDCLLYYLCELEASRLEAIRTNSTLDPDLKSDMFLLKVAKSKTHPALLLREDPGSAALPFEVAVFTGKEGHDACTNSFHTCPYNMTTIRDFLGETDFTNGLL